MDLEEAGLLMGDINQVHFVRNYASSLFGPYLEVGSKNYGSGQEFKHFLPGKELYVGVDMEPGEGVDLVIDLTSEYGHIVERMGEKKYGTIFCLSVLEHCVQPFKLANNLTQLLEQGGKIIISVPFVWKFHGYPSDYWRFTDQGVRQLFPELDFDHFQCKTSTSRDNEFTELDEDMGKISFSMSAYRKRGQWAKALAAKLLAIMSSFGPVRSLIGFRYVMAPTIIYMIGVKK